MKRKKSLWIAIIVLLFAAFYFSSKLPEPLTETFVGTYTTGGTIHSNIIAIDPYNGNCFYYTDAANNCFIKGRFKEKAENVYYISCNSAESRKMIPDQEIIHENKSFAMIMNSQRIVFTKDLEAPSIYRDEHIYK